MRVVCLTCACLYVWLSGCFLLGLCNMAYVGFSGVRADFGEVCWSWLVSLPIFGAIGGW